MSKPYRILCRDSDPEWLELRRGYLTASGVAAMLGESPWDSEESYLESKQPDAPQLEANRFMLHGRFDEDTNRRKFSIITGIPTRGFNCFMESTAIPGLACTIDGVAFNALRDDPVLAPEWVKEPSWIYTLHEHLDHQALSFGLIEMKQTVAWNEKKWLSEPPRHYQIQAQAQMHVTGYTWCILACQIGSADMRAFFIERDDSEEFVAKLRDAAERFRFAVGGE